MVVPPLLPNDFPLILSLRSKELVKIGLGEGPTGSGDEDGGCPVTPTIPSLSPSPPSSRSLRKFDVRKVVNIGYSGFLWTRC